jgi:molybdate transport system regulatory protein
MGSGNIPRLIETVIKQAGEDKRLACAEAFRIAADLDVPVGEVGRVCNELGIKVVTCQLGCF